jgi:hypothetical protein
VASGRRFIGSVPELTKRAWEDVAPQLHDFLRKLWDSEADGVPSGFNGLVPTTVEAGVGTGIGDPGTENSGWAAADHDHVASTGTPVALTPSSVNSEGTSTALARSDHTHDMSAVGDDAMLWALLLGA